MVQPQYVPPAKKGLSIWAWLAIGCVGILVLGGAATVGGMWWVAKKAKSAIAEYEDNPAMATVKMLTAVNPDLELVSTDDAAGKVTIKNKKTGEVVTVDLEDIKNGKINFETAEGKASMSFDQQAGTMEMQGADGATATIGSSELPGWVPAYPGAAPEGVYAAEDASQKSGTFGLTTGDSVNDVFAFYKKELEGAGFKVSENKYSAGGGEGGMVVGESTDGQRTVTFTIASEPGKTRVAGVFSEKKS
jgi:hypothetical protein